ncbi:membrane cofactor protein-like isoform X5 [Phascolarctos cinereus]
MLIESPRRQSAEENSRWRRCGFAVRGARVHLEPRAAAMGACPRRGAWLRSVGFLGALALLALPQASGSCNAPNRNASMQLNAIFISENYFPINSTVSFLCRPGYTLSKPGPLLSTCQDDGTWSPVSGSCKKKSCPNPQDLENGQVHIPDTSFGSEITYSCDEGYTLIGDDVRRCELDGNRVVWSGAIPFCKINTCAPPTSIENGKHNGGNKDFFTYGEVVTYHCDSRGQHPLSLIGDARIICDKDGEWDKLPPKCKEVKCKTPKVDNAVQLTGFGSFHTYKDTIIFECEDGYFFLRGNGRITCEADSNWSPVLPVCSAERPSTEPPYPSRPGSTSTSQQEPPVSSKPGPSLPPNKEPQGPSLGIIIVIVLTIVIVLAIIFGFIVYCQYKKQKGTYIPDGIHKEETHLNSLTPSKEDTLMKERFT